MAVKEATYRSFLLRLWQVEQNGALTWRCSLEETSKGGRHNFASLAEMTAFLSAVTQSTDQVKTEESS